MLFRSQAAAAPAPEAIPPSAPAENVKPPVATQAALNSSNSSSAGSGAAPPSEPAKADQSATGASAKTETAAVVSAPNGLPDKSKPEVSKADGNKVPALVENRAVPIGPPEKMMEIVLKNGRILRIGRDIELEALSRIISQLER